MVFLEFQPKVQDIDQGHFIQAESELQTPSLRFMLPLKSLHIPLTSKWLYFTRHAQISGTVSLKSSLLQDSIPQMPRAYAKSISSAHCISFLFLSSLSPH